MSELTDTELRFRNTISAQANRVGELQAALQERDAEIAALKFGIRRRDQSAEVLQLCNLRQAVMLGERDAEIDELRAALSDRRDSELRWKASCGTFSELMTKCQTKLAAQRKVLEQALDAMVNHGSPYMGLHIKDYEAAITAIQGVLK